MPRPWIIIHCITSVDGRLTTARGLQTRWEEIAPEALREYYRLSHYLGSQGILTSATTLSVAEQSMAGELMASEESKPSPVLIVPDNRGRANWTLLKRMPWLKSVIVLCSENTPRSYLTYLEEERIEYVVAGRRRVDLELALETLWGQYRLSLLQCQGGGALNGILLRRGLADELSLVVAPLAVGGTKTPTLFDATDLEDVRSITRLKLSHCQGLTGGALWLRYDVLH
jgi:2,5-diamino-6-(ribosylamino)-4(3H)-pyrimidinone 5'-phosphate reductase